MGSRFSALSVFNGSFKGGDENGKVVRSGSKEILGFHLDNNQGTPNGVNAVSKELKIHGADSFLGQGFGTKISNDERASIVSRSMEMSLERIGKPARKNAYW